MLLSVRKMNNRGLPRYLGQQNLVRHRVVSRLPAVPIPMVQAPVRMLQQPVMQAPSVIQRQVRPMRISPVPPVYQSQIMQPTFPAPRYSVQSSTIPAIPASVTRESESQYLEYADQFTRDYEYNQSQNLMEVDNFGNYAEYQQESTSFQQQQQDYLRFPTLHYQQPNQRQLQQPFQQQQYYDVQSGSQDPTYITMAPQAPVPAIPALPALPALPAPPVPAPAPAVSVPDNTVISPPVSVAQITQQQQQQQPIQLIIDTSHLQPKDDSVSNISRAQATSTPKPDQTVKLDVIIDPDKSVDNEVTIAMQNNNNDDDGVDNDLLHIASNVHMDDTDDEDLLNSFLGESKTSTSKSNLSDEDVVNLPIELLKPEDQSRRKRLLQCQRQRRYLENLIKKRGER